MIQKFHFDMKQCFRCKEIKPISSFYRHRQMADGHLGKCKGCTRVDTKKNRMGRLEYYLAYDRARANMPDRVTARKSYSMTSAGRESHRRAHRKQRNKPGWKLKSKAYNMVKRSVDSGNMARLPCEVCGSINNIQGHHDDYDKPLSVIWLCSQHHAERHKEIRYK